MAVITAIRQLVVRWYEKLKWQFSSCWTKWLLVSLESPLNIFQIIFPTATFLLNKACLSPCGSFVVWWERCSEDQVTEAQRGFSECDGWSATETPAWQTLLQGQRRAPQPNISILPVRSIKHTPVIKNWKTIQAVQLLPHCFCFYERVLCWGKSYYHRKKTTKVFLSSLRGSSWTRSRAVVIYILISRWLQLELYLLGAESGQSSLRCRWVFEWPLVGL